MSAPARTAARAGLASALAFAIAAGIASAADAPASATTAPPAAPPAAPAAGNPPASLGGITLARAERRFSVPGRFIERAYSNDPALLEYLAVKDDGYKAYESLLALETSATEFNLACLLIGLDPARARLPEYHFDPRPVQGDAVELWLEWEQDGATVRVPPARLILVDGKPATDDGWVYTGSTLLGPGRYLAEETGTLVGFIHDRDSIIEHRAGLGLGAVAPLAVNRELLPPPGHPVRLVVHNPAPAAPAAD